jgi:hypothetical protein
MHAALFYKLDAPAADPPTPSIGLPSPQAASEVKETYSVQTELI